MTVRLLRLAAVAVVCLAATFGSVGCGRSERADPAAATSGASITRPDIGFRNRGRLEEHYKKHGREFGAISRSEYLARAQLLRDRPVGGPILEARRDDGRITRFDRDSGGFVAFDQDGTIHTYFRPNDGEAYFRRQARR